MCGSGGDEALCALFSVCVSCHVIWRVKLRLCWRLLNFCWFSKMNASGSSSWHGNPTLSPLVSRKIVWKCVLHCLYWGLVLGKGSQLHLLATESVWRRCLLLLLQLREHFCNLLALGRHCCCCSICKHSEKYWNTRREYALPILTVTSREMVWVLDLYSSCVSTRQVSLTQRSGRVAWWREAFNLLLLRTACYIPLS